MGQYASALGVDDSLETLAQYVTWADQEHSAQDDTTALYNLNQFWAAEAALDPKVYAAHTSDVVYLDALSHRVSGFIYMKSMITADPSQFQDIADNMAEQFSLSSTGFTQSGHTMAASHDALLAQQAQGTADSAKASYIDDSYTTAVVDQYNAVLTSTGSLLSSAGSVLSAFSNPYLLAGAAALALLLLVKK